MCQVDHHQLSTEELKKEIERIYQYVWLVKLVPVQTEDATPKKKIYDSFADWMPKARAKKRLYCICVDLKTTVQEKNIFCEEEIKKIEEKCDEILQWTSNLHGAPLPHVDEFQKKLLELMELFD